MSSTLMKIYRFNISYDIDEKFITVELHMKNRYLVLETELFDFIYGINVDWVPEDHLEWFAGVWSRQLHDATLHGMDRARHRIKQAHDKFHDLLEGRDSD